MKLITFQSKEALEYLMQNGYLKCEKIYRNTDKYGIVYDWIIDNMNKLVKNDVNAKYPIWCWVKYNRSICPPKHKGERNEKIYAKITFDKNEKDVFITDYRKYSFLLNNIYIPNSKKDKEWFENLLEEKNVTLNDLKAYVRRDKFDSYRTDKEYNEVLKIVQNSFDRAITKDSNILQGCVWSINIRDIKSIEILRNDGYVYGSANFLRADGTRRNWIKEYYKTLK